MKIEIKINWKGLKIEWEDREYSDKEIIQFLDDIKTALTK